MNLNMIYTILIDFTSSYKWEYGVILNDGPLQSSQYIYTPAHIVALKPHGSCINSIYKYSITTIV